MNLGAIIRMNEARKSGDYVAALFWCDMLLEGTASIPLIDALLDDRLEIMRLMLPETMPVESWFD